MLREKLPTILRGYIPRTRLANMDKPSPDQL